MSSSALRVLAGSGAKDDPVYVDDVFQTTLYTGTLNTYPNNVVNGLDFDDKGGMLWIKNRDQADGHYLYDTVRGDHKRLAPNLSNAESDQTSQVGLAFNSNGFSVGDVHQTNAGSEDFAAWCFLKQEGFFDIVTYTGNGSSGVTRTLDHNLGSVPGMIIVKSTTQSANWAVYHRGMDASNPQNYHQYLDSQNARYSSSDLFGSTAPTATQFTVGWDSDVNTNGEGYVAYLFAHDAQDFGEDEDEAIIKCGSYSGNSGTQTIDVGFEAQWVLIKNTTSHSTDWFLVDTMRGMPDTPAIDAALLRASETDAEQTSGAGGARIAAKTNGFAFLTESNLSCNRSGETYIYVAIRRPHKPASEFAATDLFTTVTGRSDSVSPTYETGFVTDMGIQRRPASTESNYIYTRKYGNRYSYTDDNSADFNTTGSSIAWDYMNGVMDYFSSASYRSWNWRRAPGFFDVVTWEGTGVAKTIPHNLGVAPEMIWVFTRTSGERHVVYSSVTGNQKWLDLTYEYDGNSDTSGAYWNSTDPTASVFSVGTNYRVNDSSNSYGGYLGFLFASVDGIAKIGSYTGTGSSDIDVDCGFSNGARFVLIKRVLGTGASKHWYLFDSARGIATGNDPYIVLDTTSTSAAGAQDAIDPLSSGFKVRSTAVNGINENGGTYLFYAIA